MEARLHNVFILPESSLGWSKWSISKLGQACPFAVSSTYHCNVCHADTELFLLSLWFTVVYVNETVLKSEWNKLFWQAQGPGHTQSIFSKRMLHGPWHPPRHEPNNLFDITKRLQRLAWTNYLPMHYHSWVTFFCLFTKIGWMGKEINGKWRFYHQISLYGSVHEIWRD